MGEEYEGGEVKYCLTYGAVKKRGSLDEIALAATLVRASECDGSMKVSTADGKQWIQFAVGEGSTTDECSSPEFRAQFIESASAAVKKHLPRAAHAPRQ